MYLDRNEVVHKRSESAQAVFYYPWKNFLIKISRFLNGIKVSQFYEEPVDDDFFYPD